LVLPFKEALALKEYVMCENNSYASHTPDFSTDIAIFRHFVLATLEELSLPTAPTLEDYLASLRIISFAAVVLQYLHPPLLFSLSDEAPG